MTAQNSCASCGSKDNLKKCGRCRAVAYCSQTCQRADWKAHKPECHFTVVSQPPDPAPTDALSLLRNMPASAIKIRSSTPTPNVMVRMLNVPELRMALLSLLPAPVLLKVQRVCRSWYHAIALEETLQQRLSFAGGPGELIMAARKGPLHLPMNASFTVAHADRFVDKKVLMGIHPRNGRQQDHVNMQKSPAMDAGPRYLLKAATGDHKEVTAAEIEGKGGVVILNPFFTSLWSQDPTNMTSSPFVSASASASPRTATWRRMQLTSPPTLQVDMSIWYTNSR